MADEGVERRLAAILSADVEGYSRLMDSDEVGTVRTLGAHRAAMTGLVEHHHGRVVSAPGDAVLAEFASVVERCSAPSRSSATWGRATNRSRVTIA